MNAPTRLAIFQRFYAANPAPKTELVYHSPFELLIAVMLSAQATDRAVNQATKPLFAQANTPKTMLQLGLSGLKKYIRSIGLYNSKAKNILATCASLIRCHQGNIPNQRKLLEDLPGVGRKTANVLLNTLFDQATIAVDTHIFRVSHRTGLAKGKTPLAVEKKLLRSLPRKFLNNAHNWLVLHGRYICKAKNPLCHECLIQDLCEYTKKSSSHPRAS